MKKNKMMRLAAILLVGVLFTTSVIGGTFAKYTTADTATDNARVAKWGITVNVFGNTDDKSTEVIFGEKYNNVVEAGGTQVISNTTGEDVIAPGTNGTLATIDISGQAEVALSVEAKVDLTLAGWTVDTDTYYCPIIITVTENGGTAQVFDGTAYASMALFEAAVEEAIIKAINGATSYDADGTGKKATTNYGANENFGTAGTDVTVDWEWPFEGDDVKDTALGDQAAEGSAATIAINYTVTATQLD